MSIRKPTVEQVKAYMAEHECGVQQARRALHKQWREEILEVIGIQLSIGAPAAALHHVLEYLIELEKNNS